MNNNTNNNVVTSTENTNTDESVVKTDQQAAPVVDSNATSDKTTDTSASTTTDTADQATDTKTDNSATTADQGSEYQAHDSEWNTYDDAKTTYSDSTADAKDTASATQNDTKVANAGTNTTASTSTGTTDNGANTNTNASTSASTVAPQQETREAQASAYSADTTSDTTDTTGGSTDSQKGINVSVDHSALDDAVNKAEQTGVKVTHTEDQNQTVTSDKSDEAQQQIKDDYNQQTSDINDAIQKQEQINEANSHVGETVDHSALDEAVKNAQEAGVNVVKDDNKNLGEGTSSAEWQTVENQAKEDYQSQIDAINKATSDYQAALEKYNKEKADLANSNANIAEDYVSGTWTNEQLHDFLNQVDGNVAYISAQDGVKLESSSLDSHQILADSDWWKGLSDAERQKVMNTSYENLSEANNYHEVKVGDTWTYANATTVTDVDGNVHKVNFKYTVTGISSKAIDNVGTYVRLENNRLAVHTINGDVTYKVDFIDSTTGQPVTVNALVGIGDIDFGQGVKVNGATDNALLGKAETAQNGDGYQGCVSDTNYADNSSGIGNMTGGDGGYDPNGQAWYIVPNTSSITYTFHGTNPNTGLDGTCAYLQTLGSIPLPFKNPVKPEVPTVHYHYDDMALKAQGAVSAEYHYDNLNVTRQDVKDVEAGTTQGNSDMTIDGKDVVKGQTITFPLTPNELPANRTDDIKDYTITDILDPNFKYDSFQAFDKNGKEVTAYYTPSLTQNEDGTWKLTLTANKTLVDQMNADKSQAFDMPTIDLYGTANVSGVTIKNTYTETINGNEYNSNEVTVNTTDTAKPSKEVTDESGTDINDKNVEVGDDLNYDVTLDLSGLKDVVLTPDTIAKGLGIIDTLPDGVTLNKDGVKVMSQDGKTDLTDQFTITVDGQKVSVLAKDPEKLVREYGDTKLKVTFPTTVNDGFTGDLTNTAVQNTFGDYVETNQVVNHVPAINPEKDVIIDLGNQDSLNGKDISYGQIFDYKLEVSRPANYGGTTKEWSVTDHLSSKDEFTGHWQVMSTGDITLEDGTVIEKGSDISRYFTMHYDEASNTVKISMNQDLIDILNLPANKAVAQGWYALVQCKRVGYGDVTNVFEESYNNKIRNSNTVITHTPEPEDKTETPAPAEKKETPKADTPVSTTPVAKEETPVATEKTVTPVSNPETPAPEASPVVTPAKEAPEVVQASTPATPVSEVAQTVAQDTPAETEPAEEVMPQTGEKTSSKGLLGASAVALGMVGLAMMKRKRNDD